LTFLDPPGNLKSSMNDVWVAGADMTRVGRLAESLPDLMAVAAHAALRVADRERPDAIVIAAMNPEEFVGDANFASNVATHMGFADVPAVRVETATSSGAAAFYAGFAQIASGLARTVVVVGGEKMTHLPTPKVSELIGRSIDPYERSYGTTMPAFAALVTRALMSRHGVSEREIAQVAVKNHANGARNPLAHFRQEITMDVVLGSRMVADPLRLYHCCPISDGAAAVVLTAERASVRVAGIGQGTDALALRHREILTSFRATQAAAAAAFAMAGFGPERVDVAEIHDAFAPFELISLEDTGLFSPGKAAAATLDGETALEGRLPVNPSGGLKARGHPLAATGLAQIVECVWQLTGRVPRRQVPCNVALAQSIGGPGTNNFVTLLEAR
jgi:acetyl-CoA C-acetyltransferase